MPVQAPVPTNTPVCRQPRNHSTYPRVAGAPSGAGLQACPATPIGHVARRTHPQPVHPLSPPTQPLDLMPALGASPGTQNKPILPRANDRPRRSFGGLGRAQNTGRRRPVPSAHGSRFTYPGNTKPSHATFKKISPIKSTTYKIQPLPNPQPLLILVMAESAKIR